MSAVTLQQQIAEVRTEIDLRERSYPQLVREHRMRESVASKRLDAMRAVLESLLTLEAQGG